MHNSSCHKHFLIVTESDLVTNCDNNISLHIVSNVRYAHYDSTWV